MMVALQSSVSLRVSIEGRGFTELCHARRDRSISRPDRQLRIGSGTREAQRRALDRSGKSGGISQCARDAVSGGRDELARSGRVQIEISTRHGGLEPDQHAYLQEKAEKLQKYFGRLVAIQVVVDHVKHAW